MAGYIGNEPLNEATQTRESFTATSGQTSFATSGYTPGYLDVYFNGVHLETTDYTATNGTDVVLAVAAAADDILTVVAWKVFNPTNVSVSDITDLTATATELNYTDGVTSNIQTQLDGKQATGDYVVATGDSMTGNLSFGDNNKAYFGEGNDLQIYHGGSASYVSDQGTGGLILRTNALAVQNAGGTATMLGATDGGDVTLYHNNSSKITTTSSGVSVTGNVVVSGTVDGRDVASDGTKLDGIEAGADVTDTANVTAAGALMDSEVTNLAQVKAFDSSDYATAAQGALADSALQSIPDNYILNTGDSITGNLNFGDNNKAQFGAGNDLQIYHNGSASYISDQGTGNLKILATNLSITDSTDSTSILYADPTGPVYIYYQGNKKFETTSTGIDVTGTITADGLTLGDNQKAQFGASNDLQIYHDGSHSYISDQGTGNLRVLATNFNIKNSGNTADLFYAEDGGLTKLFYNGASKLETTSTGATVTGTLNASTDLEINGSSVSTQLDAKASTGKAIAMAIVFGG